MEYTPELSKYLLEEGLLPDDCTFVSVEFPVDSTPKVVYTTLLNEERMEKFQRAFGRFLADRREGLKWKKT